MAPLPFFLTHQWSKGDAKGQNDLQREPGKDLLILEDLPLPPPGDFFLLLWYYKCIEFHALSNGVAKMGGTCQTFSPAPFSVGDTSW